MATDDNARRRRNNAGNADDGKDGFTCPPDDHLERRK
jgi:hypothetical protein